VQELQAERAAAQQAALRVQSACEDFLRHGVPGNCCTLEAVEVEPPKLLKGESLMDGILRLQRRGREINAAIHTIQSAPYPKSDARAKMLTEVEALATLGTPDVGNLIEHHDRPIIWPKQQVRGTVYNASPGAISFTDFDAAIPLLVWLHKDALIKRLDAEIDAESDDAAALSHEERQRREAEAQGDLSSVERDEAALTWSAMEQGLPVEFRPDISVLAILQVRLVTVPRGEMPETSPGFSWPWRR
jgi:hypothetical protein